MSIAARVGIEVGTDRYPRIRMWLQRFLIGAFLLSAAVHTTTEFRLPGLVGFLGLAIITAIAYGLDGVPQDISSYSVSGLLFLGGLFCGTGIFLFCWTTWYAQLAGALSFILGAFYFVMLNETDKES